MYPENFARFYDTIYHQLRDGIDNNFFLNHLRQAKGKVLEIGVGTGRFFIDALATGADIYGIDISPSMLKILRDKLTNDQQARVSLQDIVDFSFDVKFDVIIAPFRVMMHVLEKEDQIKALNNVYKHLNPNGLFIFDTFIPDLKQLQAGLREVEDFDGEYEPGKRIRRIVSTQPDLINQRIHVEFRLEWEEGVQILEERWMVPLRFFFRYELEHLMERSHFDAYEMLGDYAGGPLRHGSRDFILIGRKENTEE